MYRLNISFLLYLALPTILGDGGHLRSETVCMKSTITNVAEQKAILVVGDATDLAPLAFLALPPSTDNSSYANFEAGVEIML